jgi:hypothetical protein
MLAEKVQAAFFVASTTRQSTSDAWQSLGICPDMSAFGKRFAGAIAWNPG